MKPVERGSSSPSPTSPKGAIRRHVPLAGLLTVLLLGIAAGASLFEGTTLPFTTQFPCSGTFWISLPSQSTIRTAEDLCSAIPNAVSVAQKFPRDLEATPGGAREWTYDCSRSICTPSPGTPFANEPGCSASTCFCVDPGEGYEVVVSAPSSLLVTGCESQVTINLPPGGQSYLISAPYQANVTNLVTFAQIVGLTSTGTKRGTIQYLDDCNGFIVVNVAGQLAPGYPLIPGAGYSIRQTNALGLSYTNPTTNLACDADGDGVSDSQDPCTDSDGDGYGDPGFPANICPRDNCPTVANPTQSDIDQDGVGDACDRCPTAYNPQQTDKDGDRIADACDSCTDSDGDGYGDPGFAASTCPPDNCPRSYNPSQADGDGDGVGDACDNCPLVPNPDQADADQDEIGDACDACSGGGPSVNVAMINSAGSINGGGFPLRNEPSGSFSPFHFFTLAVTNVSSATLGPGGVCGAPGCDTVLLNVASPGVNCNVGALPAAAKDALVGFVAGGRKLIIYDSECPPQDYSWLPFPFTTASPGALGSPATLTIVEENTLSSSNPQSRFFIDAAAVSVGTDAVSNMNVMTTSDPNWCIDMSGTNAVGVTGPVHAYARYPASSDAGLLIYNGLALDAVSGTTSPVNTTPRGKLSRIWLQELQQSTSPSCLPCSPTVVTLSLGPSSARNLIGTSHTVTARISDQLGKSRPNVMVAFSIGSGPNAAASGACAPNADCTTDATGRVAFTYFDGGGGGIDHIAACYVNASGTQVCASAVSKEWLDCDDQNPCTDDSIDPATGCVHLANTASCDDGRACTTGDRCSNGVCAGSPPPPEEVGDSLEFLDDQTLQWQPSSADSAYNLYRGSVSFRSWSFNQVCFAPALQSPDATDTDTPPPSQAFYYLASGRNACGESGLGSTSSGDPRPNLSPCP